jgi:hypothetical protein
MSVFAEEFGRVLLGNVLRSSKSTERKQLLDGLERARRIIVSPTLTSAIYDALNVAPSTIERNMDLLVPPADEVLWIEMDGHSRRPLLERTGAAAGDDDRVGYLIMRHEADPSVLVCAVARKTADRVGGACYLMPAFCAVSLPELAEFSEASRRYFDRDRRRSQRRMVMMVRAYIPPGIESEILELGKSSKQFDSSKSLLSSRGEAAPEGAFMISTLLALSSSNVIVSADGMAELAAPVLPRRYRLAAALGWRPPECGFLRIGRSIQLDARLVVKPAAQLVAA